MNSDLPTVYIALPAINELEFLPMVIDCIREQSFRNYKLVVCVNQPDAWWQDADKRSICDNNAATIDYLERLNNPKIEVIDKSSKGRGWTPKRNGVGWARKTLMDNIAAQAKSSDLIISIDADTYYGPDYFKSVLEKFSKNKHAIALSVPYYHRLTGDEQKDRAILRYEIYMRYFAINLWRIKSPYSFTAIGSAIALPVSAYKAIGGITPHKSGEDFYFLQKLRKYGRVLMWNKEKVFPAARYSDRVGFGTGPAMIKGKDGDWESYPIYPFEFFDEVEATHNLFPELFLKDVQTPMDIFFQKKFGADSIWQALRGNFKTQDKFVKACHHKVDAFRVFQYLKWRNQERKFDDEENLIRFLLEFYPEKSSSLDFDLKKIIFAETNTASMNELRDMLMEIEESFQTI